MEYSFGEPDVIEAAVRFEASNGWYDFTAAIDNLPKSKLWQAEGFKLNVNNVESHWWFHSGITFGSRIDELLLVQQDVIVCENLRSHYTRFLRLTRPTTEPETHWGSGNMVTFHDSIEDIIGEDGVINQSICQSDYFLLVYPLSRR